MEYKDFLENKIVIAEDYGEKSINPHAKLCWDSINKSYVISLYFTRQETFNTLNWEVVCQ